MRGRKRLRKKLAKAQAVLAWDRAMMRFSVKHVQPPRTFFGCELPLGFHLRGFVYDDVEEERVVDFGGGA